LRYLSERPEAENWQPDQRGERIKQFQENGRADVQAFVTFRDRPGYFHNWLMCNESKDGVHCFVECGGGDFDIKRESPTTALLYNQRFIVIGGCGSEVEEGKEVYFEPGEDDKVFRLENKPVAVCRAEEQKSMPIRIGKPLRERFKQDEAFCFGRDYDAAHLASHPQQKVSSLRVVGRLDPAGKNQWWDTVNLDVVLTLKRGGAAAMARYSCFPQAASWECRREIAGEGYTACNGRTIHLVRGRGDDVMLVNRHSGLPIDNCETVPDSGQYPQAPPTSSDDRTFQLSPMPIEACRR
jgi:hypothetical protein